MYTLSIYMLWAYTATVKFSSKIIEIISIKNQLSSLWSLMGISKHPG